MNIPKEFRTPSKPTKVVITDESGTKVVCADWCEKCDGVTAHETRCVQCSVKPQPIYDEAKERELFEAWAYSVCHVPYGWLGREYFKRMGDHYEDDYAHGLWQGWKANAQSRAKSVEVGDE